MSLIWQLKKAHAIEIGAFEAYKGHAEATKDERIKKRIQEIQHDEFNHRMELGAILHDLGQTSNIFMDFALWCIGRSISFACHYMGARAAAWGAKIMEVMGSNVYYKLSEAAYPSHRELCDKFREMARTEEEHEEFFAGLFAPQCICRYLIYLNGNKSREVNPFCRAKHKF